MAQEFSFDIVSRVEITEVKNALEQAEREVATRFDFRNSKTKWDLEDNSINVLSDDEFKLELTLDIIRSKLAKRNVSLKALEYGKIESASGGAVRQVVTLKQGIPTDQSKKIVAAIKAAGLKVQAQIQGEELRVTSKTKDELQAVQKLIKGMEELPFDVEYTNYR